MVADVLLVLWGIPRRVRNEYFVGVRLSKQSKVL